MVKVLRHVGKVAAGALPAILVAGLGLPALGAVVLLAATTLGLVCWVIRSEDRTERVSRVLLAWRGNASCLAPSNSSSAAPLENRYQALPPHS